MYMATKFKQFHSEFGILSYIVFAISGEQSSSTPLIIKQGS